MHAVQNWEMERKQGKQKIDINIDINLYDRVAVGRKYPCSRPL